MKRPWVVIPEVIYHRECYYNFVLSQDEIRAAAKGKLKLNIEVYEKRQ